MIARRQIQGLSLVEVTIALGIASFCLVAVFGLLSVGLNSSSSSVEQTTATNLLPAIAADLRTAPSPAPATTTTAVSPIYQIPIPFAVAATPSVTPMPTKLYVDSNGRVAASAPAAAYQLNVWIMPGVGRSPDHARIMLSWPPATAVTAVAVTSVDTVVVLDRN